MSDEAEGNRGYSGNSDTPPAARRVGASSGSGPELDRLPPPVFPPGSERTVHIRSAHPTPGGAGEGDELEGAFISPDAPIRVERTDFNEDAFISPDAPIRSDDPSEGVVTGMGDQDYTRVAQPAAVESSSAADHLADTLEELARGLRRGGPSSLSLTGDLSRFESTLRGFLAGYLSGQED